MREFKKHLPSPQFRPRRVPSPEQYVEGLKHLLARSLQPLVFEPASEALWVKVTGVVSDLLLKEWQSGSLVGTKPEEAFFVRCDQSTMTQSDVENGRLVSLVGVAPVRPAEFVIFQLAQNTRAADA